MTDRSSITLDQSTQGDPHGAPTHDSAHSTSRPRYDDVNVPVLVLIGIISAVLTFVTIAFVQGLYVHWTAAFEDLSPNPAIVQTLDAQKSMLTANPETGRLAIDDAMSSIAERFAQPGLVGDVDPGTEGQVTDDD